MKPKKHLKILDKKYVIDESNRECKFPIGYYNLCNDYKYFVDGNKILWIWNKTDNSFESPCLKACLMAYVMLYDDKFKNMIPSKVLEIIGISEPFKAKLYDEEILKGK